VGVIPWARLCAGNALLVATVDERGRPFAGRAWGASPVGDEPDLVRLLVDADDADRPGGFVPGARVAVTGGDPITLRSAQAKGRIVAVEAAGPDDVAVSSRHRRATFAAIRESDGTRPHLLDRMVPARLAACTIRVDECFDQTPGPGAGAPGAGGPGEEPA
jgi:hypothetical protein